ncbi:class I SAM-dependent methyltransferase [Seonamhaeicola aphaedonensis]|uniref:Methyltransferase family protein n=1 Tax=Seonamhaeicola aphaedonensis TaxID=1461338 RepID=A0A3D9HLR1_9FLAO|nr:class I SAM-dependent methyltransferase [Seonamhaeicola aphaedonensis]RED50414.1 methyltransferase family protein [Seonamhaeicola aphaedonensis]
MNQIYEKHLWGGNEFDFYSGFGSHNPNIVQPYLNAVINFLTSFENPLTVCDLGCGDFNIGKHLVPYTKKYTAVDIVEPLIERNKKLFKGAKVEFRCLDIAKDKLPLADCIILRQVLQHVSNVEIQKITKKLYSYKYVILTEHIPNNNFTPNIDIISGQGIRLKQNSGVNLLEAPFKLKIKVAKQLTTFTLENQKSEIITSLYQLL